MPHYGLATTRFQSGGGNMLVENKGNTRKCSSEQRGSGGQRWLRSKRRGFNNALGRLRTLELVQGRSELKASDNRFDSTEIR